MPRTLSFSLHLSSIYLPYGPGHSVKLNMKIEFPRWFYVFSGLYHRSVCLLLLFIEGLTSSGHNTHMKNITTTSRIYLKQFYKCLNESYLLLSILLKARLIIKTNYFLFLIEKIFAMNYKICLDERNVGH